MKRRILPILTVVAILLVAAAAIVAQEPEHKSERGTLLSISDDRATIRVEGDVDQLAVRITEATILPPQELKQGDQVIIDYNVGPDPEMLAEARAIRMDEAGSGFGSKTEATEMSETNTNTETSTTTETPTSAESSMDRSQSAQEQSMQDESMQEREAVATQDTMTESSDLPRTAGSLPVAALLGLIALGAGTLIRFIR